MQTTTCRHFTGIHYKECKLGIKYRDVTPDPDELEGSALRIPCLVHKENPKYPTSESQLAHIARKGTCEKLDFPTQEEVDQWDKECDERLKQVFEKIANGICPDCDQPMTKKQVGRCVYADPCGHRLYQGKA